VHEKTVEHMEAVIAQLTAEPVWQHDELSSAVKQLAEQVQVKLVALAQPIRLALTGKAAAPGVFELLAVLGKEESLRRLALFHAFLQKN
jgi:glutamyl-tRNA synthetase